MDRKKIAQVAWKGTKTVGRVIGGAILVKAADVIADRTVEKGKEVANRNKRK